MFSKKDQYCFLASMAFILTALICMVADPAAYGFGILTLWVAPPILFLGLLLPLIGIIGIERINNIELLGTVRNNPIKYISGFAAFTIALVTYIITLEPTASLWDCSEFIAAAYKLQVPHSPGGPLFLLIARLFSMLAGNDVTKVAWMINLMSAVFSALTVYIVFHLICFFGNTITAREGWSANIILVLSAFCGSLCLAFSDTFWFSAVEAESYAAASFFILLLVWLIITGKDLSGDNQSRRLVLIFYVTGLSYCVHPMCLLALPLLPYCWYVANRKVTAITILLTVGSGLAIVMVINRLVAVGLFELLFSFDRFFVNSLHFPFYSGAWIASVLLVVLFIFLIRRYKKQLAYTWAVLFLFAGFIPYAMLFIRSTHNPPIDENNPENLPLIKAYMNRESYGSSPLLCGPYFDAAIEGVRAKNKMYYKDRIAYNVAGTTQEYEYNKSRQTILPRLYSNDQNNIKVYRQWTGLKENEKPNFADNLEYMFRFQLGEMYFRYFLFNFAGRESDVQYSMWLKPWDKIKTSLPEKARNQYWMIPFMLGLVGAFYHYRKNKKDFFAVGIFFLITGVVLALYLNSPPNEPRERDYIYVGSFIAYCLWIGMGVMAIGNYRSPLGFFFLAVPAWMAYQNFDDHNRSGRTFQIDNARNLLQSCAPNSILFTGGDNDTFPLWYLQDVEGFRTDVRVMVSSYMNTDWYINQLRRPNYKSQPFKLTLDEKDYLQYGPNDALYIQDNIKEGIDAKKYLALLHTEHPALRLQAGDGEVYSLLPSRTIEIPVNDSSISSQNHFVKFSSGAKERTLKLNVTGNYLLKGELALLDLVVSNQWQRPVYFNFTSQSQLALNLKPYLEQEGLIYRLTPSKSASEDIRTNTDLMYKNMVVDANYKNIERSDVYLNYEDYHARMIEPLRMTFNALAVALLNEGKEDKAVTVIDRAMHILYPQHLRPSFSNLQTAEISLRIGKPAWAEKLLADLFNVSFSKVKEDLENNRRTDELTVYLLRQSADLLRETGHSEYMVKINSLKSLSR